MRVGPGGRVKHVLAELKVVDFPVGFLVGQFFGWAAEGRFVCFGQAVK